MSIIENRVLGYVECEDDINDTLEIIESIIYNTKVLDLKSINKEMTTHIILTPETAMEISETLALWAKNEL